MKINKISSKLIKPHTPTPQSLKPYNLSFIDKNNIAMNIVVILFYKSKPKDMRQRLEESLAKVLVDFYPLAGRYIKEEVAVDCSDDGAEFVEAEALDDVELLDLVAKPKTEQLDGLVPKQYFRLDEAAEDPLLSIQITHFPCGGAAVAVSVSHRVVDGASLGTFVAAWTNATNLNRKVENYHSTPYFNSPLLLPRKQDHAFSSNSSQCDDTIFIRRLSFDEAALTTLRSKIIRPNNDNGRAISGVRLVCAVITKALIRVDRAMHGKTREIIVFQPVDLRERIVPPQPKHVCCNLFVTSITRRVYAPEAEGIDIGGLVDLIGEGVRNTIDDHAGILSPDIDGRDTISNHLGNMGKEMWTPNTNIIAFSDWSKFGFYEADFGWGKPVAVNCGPQRPLLTSTMLMSNKEGDGIEAWVYLDQNSLRFFEQDEEIKKFMA